MANRDAFFIVMGANSIAQRAQEHADGDANTACLHCKYGVFMLQIRRNC